MLINIHFYRTTLFAFVIWYNRPEQHNIVSDCTQIQSYISLIYNYEAVCKFCVVLFLSIICFPLLFSNYATYVSNIIFMFVFLMCTFVFLFCIFCVFVLLCVLFCILFLRLYIDVSFQFCTSLPTTVIGWKPNCSKLITYIWCTSHGSMNTVCFTTVSDSNPKHFERHVSNSVGLCRHV